MNSHIANHVRQVLKVSYGLLFVVVGLDKVTNLHLVVDWNKYVTDIITDGLNIPSTTFLIFWGLIEIMIGILILSKATRTGAWLGFISLTLIILNLISMGGLYLDIAARDLMMAIGLYALAQLSEEQSREST